MNERPKIIENIFRKSYPSRILKLDEEISSVACGIMGYSEIEAENYAERNQKRIWNDIVKRLDEETKKGLHATFEIVDASRYELSWYPFVRKDDGRHLKQKKLRLKYRGSILNYIDNNINNREYEAIGCIISQIAGASHYYLTPSGNEFGIDFVATLPGYGKTHLFPNSYKQIRLVGQSKKWNRRVNRDKVDLT
ncbi:MAG: hypothetical protein GY795_06710 [Desulfobacterales bacterium]|nr:hypothetical protein [Desulfobacterales bacterium]